MCVSLFYLWPFPPNIKHSWHDICVCYYTHTLTSQREDRERKCVDVLLSILQDRRLSPLLQRERRSKVFSLNLRYMNNYIVCVCVVTPMYVRVYMCITTTTPYTHRERVTHHNTHVLYPYWKGLKQDSFKAVVFSINTNPHTQRHTSFTESVNTHTTSDWKKISRWERESEIERFYLYLSQLITIMPQRRKTLFTMWNRPQHTHTHRIIIMWWWLCGVCVRAVSLSCYISTYISLSFCSLYLLSSHTTPPPPHREEEEGESERG